jgi:hypothetical protein
MSITKKQATAVELKRSGMTVVDVARTMGIHVTNAHALLRRAGEPRKTKAKDGWTAARYAQENGKWRIGNTRAFLEALDEDDVRFLVRQMRDGDTLMDVVANAIKNRNHGDPQ